MTDLKCMTLPEIETLFQAEGLPKFRAKQV